MAAGTVSIESQPRSEDALAHLPVSSTTEYPKGTVIYGPDRPSNSIYLVISGTVGVSHIAENSSEVLMEIVRPDEIFGESAFLEVSARPERAVAIDRVILMAWAIAEVEDLMAKRPRLAVALLQVIARRNAEFTRRIESFSIDNIERRLARSLLRLSERLGSPEEDGSVRMMPFTHELLSQYVGTSREVVTQHMNRFRKQGLVNYSRDGIQLCREALKTVFDRRERASAETVLPPC